MSGWDIEPGAQGGGVVGGDSRRGGGDIWAGIPWAFQLESCQ